MSLIIPFPVGSDFISYSLQEQARLQVLEWKPSGIHGDKCPFLRQREASRRRIENARNSRRWFGFLPLRSKPRSPSGYTPRAAVTHSDLEENITQGGSRYHTSRSSLPSPAIDLPTSVVRGVPRTGCWPCCQNQEGCCHEGTDQEGRMQMIDQVSISILMNATEFFL